MLEKLRNNPRIVVVALIAAGVLAIAVAAGNNNTNQPAAPESSVESGQSTDTPSDDAAKTDDATDDSEDSGSDTDTPTGTSSPQSVVKSGIDNVDVRTEGGTYKTTVKGGNNQTVIVRKMVSDYLASKSENLSDEQKLYIETTIVSNLPPKDKIFSGEEVIVTEDVMTKTVDASKQLTQEQIKRWSAYL